MSPTREQKFASGLLHGLKPPFRPSWARNGRPLPETEWSDRHRAAAEAKRERRRQRNAP